MVNKASLLLLCYTTKACNHVYRHLLIRCSLICSWLLTAVRFCCILRSAVCNWGNVCSECKISPCNLFHMIVENCSILYVSYKKIFTALVVADNVLSVSHEIHTMQGNIHTSVYVVNICGGYIQIVGTHPIKHSNEF